MRFPTRLESGSALGQNLTGSLRTVGGMTKEIKPFRIDIRDPAGPPA
jgi:hypothetical protein